MPDSTHRLTTDSRAQNAMSMINMAVASTAPERRAGFLADAERQIAFALSSCLDECEEQGVSWAIIGDAVGLGRETVWRQHKARGPIVVIKSTHTRKEEEMIDSIYAFETETGVWFGPEDDLETGQYTSGAMPFNPNPAAGENKLGGQVLRVRIGPQPADAVSAHAAMVHMPDGAPHRVRVTDEAMALLFNDSDMPLRRALTASFYALINNENVDPAVRTALDTASNKMNPQTVPKDEFLAAIRAVLDAADSRPTADTEAQALITRLRRAVRDYESWNQLNGN